MNPQIALIPRPCSHVAYLYCWCVSIAAQSSFLLGAVLNATFGSVVEIILYLSVMIKGEKSGTADCYPELVKSALTGWMVKLL